MIHKAVPFLYTHDIGSLIDQIKKAGVIVPSSIETAAGLSEFAVQTRYPGWGEPVTEAEYNEAVDIASNVVKWVDSKINF